jgi:diamine N-acetyltransferase
MTAFFVSLKPGSVNITIRKAGQKDFPQIIDLINEFAIFQQTPWKVSITLEQMEKDKDFFQCFVAETNDQTIIGFTTCYFTFFSWSGKGLYLDDLYVSQLYRKQQIGSRLLQAVIDLAKKEQCKKLRWQVSSWNKNAIDFYKKVGAIIDEVDINCELNLNPLSPKGGT